ncbi:MAG: DUF255 domain-containing protein, partial [Alphaproteobacteria bacterium]
MHRLWRWLAWCINRRGNRRLPPVAPHFPTPPSAGGWPLNLVLTPELKPFFAV